MRVALTLLLSLAACGPAGSDASPSPEPDRGRPSSLAPASTQPTRVDAGGDTITGVLGADAIEGGCAYLETADGTRYEVIWPDGWELQASPLELRDPEGAVVAEAGDEVTVRGEEATDMASTCQIGPIFRATGVER
jgi:hypothetical protein